MPGELSIWHWLVVAAVVMLLFGYQKLPDAARSIGRSLRILKSEMRGMQDDGAQTSPAPPPVTEGGARSAGERRDRAGEPD